MQIIQETNGHKNGKKEKSQTIMELYRDVVEAIHSVGSYGSVELYIQNRQVTQITARKIKKTQYEIAHE